MPAKNTEHSLPMSHMAAMRLKRTVSRIASRMVNVSKMTKQL